MRVRNRRKIRNLYFSLLSIICKEDAAMQFLNISSQNAKIQLNIENPQINLRTTLPQIELFTQAAIVEINQVKGELEIDQSPCRASLGLKNWTEFARDDAERGKQAALEAVGRISEEGDRLAGIEKEKDAIVNIAAEKITPEDMDVEIGWIDNPIINYKMNSPYYNFVSGKVDLQVQTGSVENNFQWGKVNISIAQYQSIKFWTTENKYDMYI